MFTKDYTGEDVTYKNSMAVLKGDEKTLADVGSGKVRKSSPSDHVFVYFADHGAPGFIAFPEDELSAMDLNRTINKHVRKKQHENNIYGKMVIYIEAYESGSLFENILPNNIKVYTTTAAKTPLMPADKRDTYLGDSFSVHWK
ncbi:legumain [Trichonephila clavipes]|nr:legumain [Trichonephila clavipes]